MSGTNIKLFVAIKYDDKTNASSISSGNIIGFTLGISTSAYKTPHGQRPPLYLQSLILLILQSTSSTDNSGVGSNSINSSNTEVPTTFRLIDEIFETWRGTLVTISPLLGM